MTFNKYELERIAGDYRNVEQKAEEIVHKLNTNKFYGISNIGLWGNLVCIHYNGIYGTNRVFVPIEWFELDGDEFTETIDAYKRKEHKNEF